MDAVRVTVIMKGMYYYLTRQRLWFPGHMAGGFKYYKSKETGGAPEAGSRPFFVTELLDAELLSNTKIHCSMRCKVYTEWSYDVSKIECLASFITGRRRRCPYLCKEKPKLINASELIIMEVMVTAAS